MRKFKAFIYLILGISMCWVTFRQGNYGMSAGIFVFVAIAIAVTLASIGQTEVSWDQQGITIKKKPKPPKFIGWTDLKKLKVDHLGYEVIGRRDSFRLRKENMPKDLLLKIRDSLRANETHYK